MNFKFLITIFLTLPIISAFGMEDQNQRNNQGNPRARRLFALAGPIDHQSFDEELDALLDATHFTLEQEKAFNTADDNFNYLILFNIKFIKSVHKYKK